MVDFERRVDLKSRSKCCHLAPAGSKGLSQITYQNRCFNYSVYFLIAPSYLPQSGTLRVAPPLDSVAAT
jgi:hypothetical protein